KSLRQMNMCIDQARYDQLSTHINDLIIPVLLKQNSRFVNRYNAISLHGDSTIADNVTLGIHGDDCGVGEKHMFLLLIRTIFWQDTHELYHMESCLSRDAIMTRQLPPLQLARLPH